MTAHEDFALWRIMKGYFYGCVTAAIVLLIFLLLLSGYFSEATDRPTGSISAVFIVTLVLVFFAYALSILPVTFILITAEIFHIRHSIFYTLSGAVIGFGVTRVIDDQVYTLFDLVSFMSSGALAGLVYWHIAGRDAGRGRWPRF
ncbi:MULTISPECIES: hypothetical protein [Stappiaceae]|uniref:hypothetical protein n=1 Tax=Stappiaceae TaxID=2821832 RepID=UPI001ADBAE46|nr:MULTISPECIES: hypothetical protein [Stappiaceae]MBO9426255.1 hypothetical protein [Labrenzia sp. R4_1]